LTSQTSGFDLRIAHRKAIDDLPLFRDAQQIFGHTLLEAAEDAPPAIALAHIACYNPSLEITPRVTEEGRRGFLKLTVNEARKAGVEWEDLDTPEVCAFVWNHGMNSVGVDHWGEYSLRYAAPDTDFWNTVYTRFILGETNFKRVWDVRDTTKTQVLNTIIYGVSNNPPNLLGWNPITRAKFFGYALPYVAFLWARGGRSLTGGYGKLPSIPKTTATKAFRLE